MPGGRRDDAALTAGLDRWLAHHEHDVDASVVEMARPGAGHTNETILLRARVHGSERRLVVRLPPLIPSFPDDTLTREAAVLAALATAGIDVPAPTRLERDREWLGAPFLVMPVVAGHVVGEAPVLDPWVATSRPDQQTRIEQQFLAALGSTHRLVPSTLGLDAVLRGAGASIAAEVGWWAEYLDWGFDGDPPRALRAAVEWLTATVPADRGAPSILWGDARLGNAIFDESRTLVARLDWELASIGPAEMDLAWYLATGDLLEHFIRRRPPAFLERDAVIRSYEHALGRRVESLPWHEVFALTRSSAINARQARMARVTGEPYPGSDEDGNPVFRYLERRIAEIAHG